MWYLVIHKSLLTIQSSHGGRGGSGVECRIFNIWRLVFINIRSLVPINIHVNIHVQSPMIRWRASECNHLLPLASIEVTVHCTPDYININFKEMGILVVEHHYSLALHVYRSCFMLTTMGNKFAWEGDRALSIHITKSDAVIIAVPFLYALYPNK